MASVMNTGNEGVATDETGSLIAASKVNGTTVYNSQGESLGSIYDVMIDKPRGSGLRRHVVRWLPRDGRIMIPFPGRCLPTTPSRAAMSSISTKTVLKERRDLARPTVRWEDPAYTGSIDDFYARYEATGFR